MTWGVATTHESNAKVLCNEFRNLAVYFHSRRLIALPGRCPFSPSPKTFLTKEYLPMWGWILRTIAVGAGKALTLGEYNRIKKENKLASDYHILIAVLNEIAKKRAVTCKVDETSRDCPISFVIPH